MNDWQNQVALVVEDSQLQREYLVRLLKGMGFGVVLQAGNGQEALCVIEGRGSQPLDLVVTDLDMPVMDGIELMRILGERQLARSLIVVSARDPRMLEVVEKMGSEDAGLHLLGTVAKPVHPNELLATLQREGERAAAVPSSPDRARFDTGELEAALEAGQFIPYYQPLVSVTSGQVRGVEVLARWQHPVHGTLQPLHFIPRIEGSPLMLPFTLNMVAQALDQMAQWRDTQLNIPSVSMNLSAENLADVAFIERLTHLTVANGIAPEAVIWEVTETMVMSNLSQCLANLVRLRLKGFGLAMDDYGVGYSSMQQLSSCPFTELKIDRVFVNGASKRANRRAVLESSIEMGHRLNAEIVAEGVEYEEDMALLRELGCDFAQGYLVAKPMPALELQQWMQRNPERWPQDGESRSECA
jgi:EAL domain-containing protein (putative c-di-GMP-specific phosphodiesterase class I)/CheY-like chemotaxis protein